MAVNTKDKYYTPEWLVKHTVKKAVEIIGKENITDIIEPSAGDGAFIEELDKLAKELGINVEYYDLYPSHPRIVKMDYKKLIKSYKKGRLIIGNPPFGTSSSLWKAFCKKSAKIGDFIAFVSPASQYNSNYYFKEGELIYSELLNDVEYRGDKEYGGKDQKVRTCLNIYKVYDREEEEDWRIKRLEQDVKIIAPFGPEENVKRYIDCDFFIARMHTVGAIYENFDDIPTNVKSSLITVRILNKDVKDKVRSVLQNLKEYYKNEYTAATVSTMSNMFLKEYLIKHLYPTREERLEQDIQIVGLDSRDPLMNEKLHNYDWYLDRFKTIGKPSQTPRGDCFAIKILNENVRSKVDKVMNEFDTKYRNDICRLSNGTPVLSIFKLRDILITNLYPTREERLEQDIEMVNVKKASKKNNDFICDFYIGSWGAGVVGKIYNDIRYEDQYGVKIHNDEKRKQIEEFFYSYREKYVLTGEQYAKSVGGAWLVLPFLKSKLIELLYPTREERLEQDVLITILEKRKYHTENGVRIEHEEHKNVVGDHGKYGLYEKQEYDIIIDQYYGGGKIVDDIIKSSYYLLRCKDKNTYKKILELLNSEVYKTFVKNQYEKLYYRIDGNEFRDFIKKNLYPQDDPSFSEYEDYDYPEVRKPVHVERAVHGKALIPVEYREEIVKTPKEETKVAAVALF